jgi:hypothetical protein
MAEEETCMHTEALKEVGNMIRDLINFVEVKKSEELEGATQRIEDDTAKEIQDKLRAIAEKLGLETL